MRSIFLYIILIGIPVILILGVLGVGQRLRPPIYVGGAWKIEQTLKTGDDSSCGDSAIDFDGSVLVISQSGTRLLLTLNDENRTSFSGEIHDATITASMVRRSPNTSLKGQGGDSGAIQLHAGFERDNGPDCLICTLTFNGCSPPMETSFIAKRQAAGAVEGQ